jgi:hypothetical protein
MKRSYDHELVMEWKREVEKERRVTVPLSHSL